MSVLVIKIPSEIDNICFIDKINEYILESVKKCEDYKISRVNFITNIYFDNFNGKLKYPCGIHSRSNFIDVIEMNLSCARSKEEMRRVYLGNKLDAWGISYVCVFENEVSLDYISKNSDFLRVIKS